MLPILVNESDFEPTAIKKANQFISFNFGNNQLSGLVNFFSCETSFDSFLNPDGIETFRNKRILPIRIA